MKLDIYNAVGSVDSLLNKIKFNEAYVADKGVSGILIKDSQDDIIDLAERMINHIKNYREEKDLKIYSLHLKIKDIFQEQINNTDYKIINDGSFICNENIQIKIISIFRKLTTCINSLYAKDDELKTVESISYTRYIGDDRGGYSITMYNCPICFFGNIERCYNICPNCGCNLDWRLIP